MIWELLKPWIYLLVEQIGNSFACIIISFLVLSKSGCGGTMVEITGGFAACLHNMVVVMQVSHGSLTQYFPLSDINDAAPSFGFKVLDSSVLDPHF